MSTLIACLLIFAAGVALGYWMAQPEDQTEELPESASTQEVAIAEAEEAQEEFVVAGRRRPPTWRERRRELEAAARTERRKLEEWRD